MRNQRREAMASDAAEFVRQRCRILESDTPPIALILGTGWGDVLDITDAEELPFETIPGFSALTPLEGHARWVVAGSIVGKDVVVLRRRVHLGYPKSLSQ